MVKYLTINKKLFEYGKKLGLLRQEIEKKAEEFVNTYNATHGYYEGREGGYGLGISIEDLMNDRKTFEKYLQQRNKTVINMLLKYLIDLALETQNNKIIDIKKYRGKIIE
jgi:hypothetical protein